MWRGAGVVVSRLNLTTRTIVSDGRRSLSTIVFPNERYGVDYGTNWAAASCGVTIGGEKVAFRNPAPKTYFAFNRNWVDQKSRVVSRDAGETQVLTGQLIDEVTFDEIEEVALGTLNRGTSGARFVLDASAGVDRAARVNVRVVSDDAGFGYLLKTMLCPVPNRGPQEFYPDVKVVHSAVADADAGKPYCAVYGNKVVARGNVSAAAIAEAIGAAAKGVVGSKPQPSLAVTGSAYVDESGKVKLFVGGNPSASKVKGLTLAAAHNCIWSASGVSRMWNSTHSSEAKVSGSVVENGVSIVPLKSNLPNQLAHPSEIVFLAKGSKGAVEPEEAVQLLGGAEETVKSLLELSGAKLSRA